MIEVRLSKGQLMQLRHAALVVLLSGLAAVSTAFALDLSDLTNKEVVAGLKEALIRSSQKAVDELGKPDGFLGNVKVKIPLPESLHRVEGVMRTVGLGDQADELIATINHAAEAAVPEAKTLLVNAVKQMSVQDAKGILSGGDTAATEYFRKTTSAPLTTRFLPIVKRATAKVKLAEVYNNFAGKAAGFGLIGEKDANLNNYVTQKALDGLFTMMADEEKAIRQNPAAATKGIIKKVFGAIGQ
jgi:hypothetical protein